MIRWYVVQTQAAREQDAALELRKQGFDAFAPQFLQRREVRRQVIYRPRPLFPGYGFVAFDANIHRWRSINGTRGVIRLLVADGEYPVAVPQGEMENLRAMVDEDGFVHLDDLGKPWACRTDHLLRVTAGPFRSLAGLCQENDETRAKALLSILGQERPVSIHWRNLEVLR